MEGIFQGILQTKLITSKRALEKYIFHFTWRIIQIIIMVTSSSELHKQQRTIFFENSLCHRNRVYGSFAISKPLLHQNLRYIGYVCDIIPLGKHSALEKQIIWWIIQYIWLEMRMWKQCVWNGICTVFSNDLLGWQYYKPLEIWIIYTYDIHNTQRYNFF